jgi:ABC-type dipeptide/oligopeptide/nickel transport system permease subunit
VRAGWRRFRRNEAAVWAAAGLGGLVLFCLVAPVVSPYDPYAVDFAQKLELPSLHHWLGTDFFGRDLLERMALGGRLSMFIALVAIVIILALGLLYGTIAGVAGGKVDELMMRVLDALFAVPRLPGILIILVLVGANGNVWTVVLALSLFSWMTTARLVRGQIIALKQNDYVRAARALGARPHQIVLRHILHNTFGILLVAVLLELPGVILNEAFVSVLGLGINPPTATWGNIAQDALGLSNAYFLVLPSAAIALFAVAVNFIADGLQDALDPRRENVGATTAWSPLQGFIRPAARVTAPSPGSAQ